MVRALPRPSYWLGIPPTGQSLDGEDLWTAIKDAAGFRLFWIKSKTCDLADLACSCSGLCSNSLLGFSLAPSCGACTMSGCNTCSQYRKSEAATLGRKLKAEAPTRHRGQSALGQGANLMSSRY